MLKIGIRTNFPDVQRKLDAMQRDLGDQALRMAVNRTADRARTQMTRAITDEFAIRAGEVRPNLRVSRARRKASAIEAELAAFPRKGGRRSRNVMLFGARRAPGKGTKRVRFETPEGWRTRTVRTGGGVSVKILRAGPRKVIAGAFIGNGGRTVFMRAKGAARLPIQGVETIDVQQMFNTRRVNAKVIAAIEAILPVEFERAAALVVARFNREGS